MVFLNKTNDSQKKLCDTNKNVTKMEMIMKRGYYILERGENFFECPPHAVPMCWHTIDIVEKSSQYGVIPKALPSLSPPIPSFSRIHKVRKFY
jgi:hypothetical protein